MRHFPLILIISLCWVLSEILLAVIRKSRGEGAGKLDKSSFRLLWLVIVLAITAGVSIATKGIGLVQAARQIAAYLGISLILAGLVIRWVSIITLGKYFTVNVNISAGHTIIKSGIYKYVRHPSYSGSLLSFLGLGIYFSNWASLVVIFIPITASFIYRIKIEEKALKIKFGREYEEYSSKTARLVPGLF
ncbi:Isoprenylcysteine carboxyl methyltransferase [Candidatus Zixiibacteriota bacterium]|nr:Isoprenylcysteine carboxyl methyltransferase [candidate division Zixibacteria bacterium]